MIVITIIIVVTIIIIIGTRRYIGSQSASKAASEMLGTGKL